jgi:hypothetical protein
MEDSLPKIWRNHIVSSKARIVESSLIRVDRYAAGVLDNYRLRYRVGNPPKFAFILPQSLLTLLEVFDVSAYSVPHNDLPGFVAEGFEANEEPTKDPIMAAHARFDFAWFAGNQQLAPSPHQRRQILRMDRNLPAPALRFFGSKTGVFAPPLIHELYGAIRMS